MKLHTEIEMDATDVTLPTLSEIDGVMREQGAPDPSAEWYDEEGHRLVIQYDFEATDLWDAYEHLNGENGVHERLDAVLGHSAGLKIAKPRELARA